MKPRELLLIGAAGALAVLVYFNPFGGDDAVQAARPADRTAAPGADRPAAGEAMDARPVEAGGPFLAAYPQFAALDERPLFTPDRRPPRAAPPPERTDRPAPTPAPAQTRPPDIIVTGVAAGPEGRGSALVQDRGETVRLYVGDLIEGWRLEAVEPDAIVITREDERWRIPIGPQDET